MSKLTPEQKLVLQNHLTADPNGKGYAADVSSQAVGTIVVKLNAQDVKKAKFNKIMTLTMLRDLPDLSDSIIGKLESMAQQSLKVKEVLTYYLRPPGTGIDIADPETITMIDSLTAPTTPLPTGFTTEEAAALKNMAMLPATEMEQLNLPVATEEMIWEILGGV
jgi:hypothetical protein